MKWRTANLGEVAADGGLVGGPFGSNLVSSDYEASGVPVIRGSNLNHGRFLGGTFAYVSAEKFARDLERNAAIQGDLVFTQRGTLGQVAMVSEGRYVVSQSQMRLRANLGEALPEFIYYACTTPHFHEQIRGEAIQTGVPHINLGILSNLVIPLPDLRTQTAIAEVLGSLDDKIAANERVAETATDLAVALLTERSARLLPTTLAELAALRKVQVQPSQWDTVAHFSLPAFDEGQRPAIERADDIKSTKFLITKSCVLLSKLNPRIPRIWDVSALPTLPALASTEFLVLEPNGIPSTVLCATLRLGSSLEEMVSLARGTSGSHQRVAPNEAMELTVPDVRQLPRSDAQLITALGHQRHAAIAQQAHLAATRDALLPALMSGELSVGDVAEVPGL